MHEASPKGTDLFLKYRHFGGEFKQSGLVVLFDEEAVTIAAFDLVLSIEAIPDLGMAQRTATAVADNLVGMAIDFNGFGSGVFSGLHIFVQNPFTFRIFC
jgi:hypothetical protein